MKPAICIPIIETTIEKMKASIEKMQSHADFIEIRSDYVVNLTSDGLADLKAVCKKPAILTCRGKEDKGMYKGSEESRRSILQSAFDLKFDYVDVELLTIKEIAFKKSEQSKMIISHHDFTETPDYWDLTKIIDEMSSYAPDIYKIATTVKKEKDVVALFRLLTNKQGKTMIIAGMGEHGKIVRILSPYLGNLFTFAASDNGGSAPGQIHYKKLQEIYNLIESEI